MRNKVIKCIAATMMFSALMSFPVMAEGNNYGYVSAEWLNVRNGDSTENEILGCLKKGTEVNIVDETENGWYQINFECGTAYVSGKYISEDDASNMSEDSENNSDTNTWNGPVLNRSNGTVQGPSGKETYYNLDMSGVVNIMRNMGNSDEYWVREDGVKMLGNYIMCAANLSVHPRGSLVESSLGTCIVCDTGSFAYSNPNQLDIVVNW